MHSVSAVGEQYLDLASQAIRAILSPGQTITKSTVPAQIGPSLDAANRGLAVLPKEKIGALLDETAQAVGGLGPALQRLVDSTQAIAGDFKTNISDVNDIIENSAPILDSQVNSSDAIAALVAQSGYPVRADRSKRPARAQHPEPRGTDCRSGQLGFSDVREALPQTLANLEIVLDMLKRYHKGVEQLRRVPAAKRVGSRRR